MGVEWFPDSQWGVYSFTLEDRFSDFLVFRLIDVGGGFRTVRIRRANGVTEWLLDNESLVVLPDTKARRTVFTRVVGTAATFQYEVSPTSASRVPLPEVGGGTERPCGNCKPR